MSTVNEHMMQAISARYCGPTACNGSRVKVQCAAKTMFVEWDDALNAERNYIAAVKVLIDKLQWKVKAIGGCLKDGSYVFVLVEK